MDIHDLTYNDYHTHPVNKMINFFCIPLIVITTITFINKSNLKILGHNLYETILTIMLGNYLYNYGLVKFTIMVVYFGLCDYYSFKWQKRRFWLMESIVVFSLAWIMQFIGHYIEGNRHALIDSLTSAVSQAPLFSVMYLFQTIDYLIGLIL